ncbi:MAG: SPW repeat protein [Burkholderiales bacterium]|nr:SPW repeat protein [Burkholderiales bacterium]
MKQLKHWQDPVNCLLGLWFVLSPWVVGYQGMSGAVASAIVLGILMIIASFGAMMIPKAWEEWSQVVLGILMIIAPWVVQFSSSGDAMRTSVITGIVTLILALWTLLTDKDYGSWAHGAAH